MASTGAYRQVLQQVFAIPIEDENTINNSLEQIPNNNKENDNEDNNDDGFSEFNEFADNESENNIVSGDVDAENMTEEFIEQEFANF